MLMKVPERETVCVLYTYLRCKELFILSSSYNVTSFMLYHVGATLDKLDEKENRRNPVADNSSPISNVQPPSAEAGVVPRDRFGRPFQSLEKKGRGGRDFYGGSKRFERGPSSFPQHGAGATATTPEKHKETDITPPVVNNINSSQFSKSRLPPPGRPNMPIPGPGIGKTAGGNTFNDRSVQPPYNKPSNFTPYEQPPRFSEESSKIKSPDPVDPSLRQLVRKNECPADIKENIDGFYDINSMCPNEKYTTILRKHCINFLLKVSFSSS